MPTCSFRRPIVFLIVLLVALLPGPALAQTDSDGDGIENSLEVSGFHFDLLSGDVVSCDPSVDDPCYVTDPLSWSSDGDPYSDFQEASGVNMDATVRGPYNSPLVAAYPVIEVVLHQYTFTSNATITDASGQTLSSGESFTSSTSTTSTSSVSVGAGVSSSEGLSVSAEGSYSYSETAAYAEETTSGEELNWETATSTELDDAGTLSLSLLARNTGGATALNVRPTFNVYIGEDLMATVLPDVPFRQSLAPGEASPPVVPLVDGEPLALTLSFDRLVAVQSGAPITIEVVDILADIQRWRPQDSNWECGTGETCSWTSFQNQILPRTLRLLVDFGYSGDPEADIPFRFRGNPFEYRVYTGSPSTDPAFTLRDVLAIVDYNLEEGGGDVVVEGRPYPSGWVLAEQPDRGGFTPILQAWSQAGEPAGLLDVVMPRQATLFMTSPDPEDPGAAIRQTTFTPDLLHVRAAAVPRGGLPIVSAEAHVWQHGEEQVVPLVLAHDGAYWTTEGSGGPPIDIAIGAASSYVTFTDASGAVQRNEEPITLPNPQATSCAEVAPEDLVDVVDGAGRTVLFPSGDLDVPVEAYCAIGSETTRFWVPQTVEANIARLFDFVVVEDRRAVAATDGLLLRSRDRGRTWEEVSGIPTDIRWLQLGHRPGSGIVVAAGWEGGEQGSGLMIRSADGGETWSSVAGSFTHINGLHHAEGETWFAAGGNSATSLVGAYRSDDDGRTWAPLPLPPSAFGVGDLLFRDASMGLLLESAFGSTDVLWRTTDGGTTWTEVAAVSAGTYMNKIAYTGDDTWYLTVGNLNSNSPQADLYRSQTDGAPDTWEVLSLPASGGGHPNAIAFSTPDIGFITDRAGLHRTVDGGDTWTFEPYPTEISFSGPLAVFDRNRIIAAGGTTGILMTTSGGVGAPITIVATEPDAPRGRLAALRLAPNHPNPFRQRTTLTYRLDAPTDVSLNVYDLLGREVARLVDAQQAAGSYEVDLDAHGWAAGVYLARLRAGSAVATRSILLVR